MWPVAGDREHDDEPITRVPSPGGLYFEMLPPSPSRLREALAATAPRDQGAAAFSYVRARYWGLGEAQAAGYPRFADVERFLFAMTALLLPGEHAQFELRAHPHVAHAVYAATLWTRSGSACHGPCGHPALSMVVQARAPVGKLAGSSPAYASPVMTAAILH